VSSWSGGAILSEWGVQGYRTPQAKDPNPCSDGTPAYRARRRTEPTDASACYNTGAAGPDASRFERIL